MDYRHLLKHLGSTLIIIILVVLAIGSSDDSGDNTSFSNSNSTESTYNPPDPLTAKNVDHHWEYDMLMITGEITNTRDHTVDMVRVNFNLYDSEGNIVGKASDFISDLSAGQTWSFEATVFVTDNVAKYELTDVEVTDYSW